MALRNDRKLLFLNYDQNRYSFNKEEIYHIIVYFFPRKLFYARTYQYGVPTKEFAGLTRDADPKSPNKDKKNLSQSEQRLKFVTLYRVPFFFFFFFPPFKVEEYFAGEAPRTKAIVKIALFVSITSSS